MTTRRRTKAEIERARRKAVAARKHHLRTVHRMTPEQYQALLDYQGGVCAFCGKPPITRLLHVDHDHEKARRQCSHPHKESCQNCWRGLLHGPCNQVFAIARDRPEAFERGVEYLKNPPAQEWRLR